MISLAGYWRTLRQYWRSPKGRHDILDYARAALAVTLTMAAVAMALAIFFRRE